MALLNQVIQSPARTGKTKMLLALASGYSSQNIPGVIIVPTNEKAAHFKKNYAPEFDVWGLNQLAGYLKSRDDSTDPLRVFLLDDADRMLSIAGHPKAWLEKALLTSTNHHSMFSFCSNAIVTTTAIIERDTSRDHEMRLAMSRESVFSPKRTKVRIYGCEYDKFNELITDKFAIILHLRDVFINNQRDMEFDQAYFDIKNHILLRAPSFGRHSYGFAVWKKAGN